MMNIRPLFHRRQYQKLAELVGEGMQEREVTQRFVNRLVAELIEDNDAFNPDLFDKAVKEYGKVYK